MTNQPLEAVCSNRISMPQMFLGYWINEERGWFDTWKDAAPEIDAEPTHWMPLPLSTQTRGSMTMAWRYQPVFTEHAGERSCSLCEVYFDDAGNFTSWTESEAIAPGGDDLDALTADIARMMADAFSYEPVRFSDLKPGMRFARRISMEDRQALAEFVEHSADAFKRAPKPLDN